MGSIVGFKAELASPADFKHWVHGVVAGTESLREITNLLGACSIFIAETVPGTSGSANSALRLAKQALLNLDAAERSGFVADIASADAGDTRTAFIAQRALALDFAKHYLGQAIASYDALCRRVLFVNPGLVEAYPQLAEY